MSVYYRDDNVTLHEGDCLDVLGDLPDNSVDSVCADPPYSLSFMGRDWDRHATPTEFQTWCQQWATECLRVLRPGGHMLAFGGTRTHHRLASAIEDAGFEIRDSIAWLYGSGFPKSLDVSKAIDKAAGAEREVVGTKLGQPGYSITDGNGEHRTYGRGLGNTGTGEAECSITAPATDAAHQWQGWGTALKPAFEPIVVARKPIQGTIAANVLAHGTGALNIDGCRIAHRDEADLAESTAKNRHADFGSGARENRVYGTDERTRAEQGNYDGADGRWPANVVLDGAMAGELDQQSGYQRTGITGPGANGFRSEYVGGEPKPGSSFPQAKFEDGGGASRFFPTFRYIAKAPTAQRPTADGISHPTVKPLDLMRWLVRLVTPPHGIVLDPFAGSGTTGEAAIHEHMRAVLIEREPTYLPLIVARLSKPMEVAFDFDPVGEHIAATMFTPGGTAAYEPIPLTYDGEPPA